MYVNSTFHVITTEFKIFLFYNLIRVYVRV